MRTPGSQWACPRKYAGGFSESQGTGRDNFNEIAKMLILNNAHINCVQKAGITPLHSAAQNGNIEIIILLLEKGANVSMRMEGGKLPCTLAQEKGFMEIAEILGV